MSITPAEQLYSSEYFSVYQPTSPDHLKRMEMYGQEHARIRRFIQGGNVLDVGCGVGDFLNMFEAGTWTKYGIDVSKYALEQAAQKGVRINLPEDNDSFFDLIVFRGTIQHIDEPISMLKRCIRMLKPGGYIVFLATPNIGGLVYRLFQDLPMLDSSRNFMLVSEKILRNILQNLGLTVLKFHFPYRGSPYARPWRDCFSFGLRCMGVRRSFAFWRNMMECYAQKDTGTSDTLSGMSG